MRTPSVRTKAQEAERPEGSARDRLLTTARSLFYREGARAVGIDRVLAESGVAKMSLYRYFPSKDDLIRACLQEQDEEYWSHWDAAVAEVHGGPVARLRSLFARLAKRSAEADYRGCAFLNTAADFPDPEHPARGVIIEHKRKLYDRLLRLAEEAGARDPKALARQLVLLTNGAQATSGMLGKEVQESLIAAGDALLAASGIKVPSTTRASRKRN